jgi:ComF family protein
MGIREFMKLMSQSAEGCVFCGREIPSGDVYCAGCGGTLDDCRPRDVRTGGVLHVYKYQGPVRELLRRYKYDDRPRSAFFAAQEMYEFMEKEGIEADIVSFVPVHKNRKKDRGYDQSEMLAVNLAALCGGRFAALLERTRDTAPQYRLSADARKKNVGGAFSVVPGSDYAGARILLIDDIYTTGSTMSECAKALAGKAEVIPFVFAKEYME